MAIDLQELADALPMLDSLEKLLLERNKIGPMGAQAAGAAGAGGGPGDLVEFDHGKLGCHGNLMGKPEENNGKTMGKLGFHGIFMGFDEILRVIFMGFNEVISNMPHVLYQIFSKIVVIMIYQHLGMEL